MAGNTRFADAQGTDSVPAAEESQWLSDSEEGGMIELAAAAYASAHPSHTSPAADATRPRLSPSTGVIQMDVGVGLFQAFELATAPVEQAAQAEATSADGDSPDPQTNSAACAASDAEPAAEQSAGTDEPTDQSVQRAVAAPAVLAAALLLRGAARKRDDEEASADPENGQAGSSR